MDKHIKTVSDEEKEVENQCTYTSELIVSIQHANTRQIAEVNRLKEIIHQEVNTHHDGLITKVESANQETINFLQHHGQMFTEARQQLADKRQFLTDVSQTNDTALLTDTLKNLSQELQQELAAIRSKLPKLDRNLKSSVRVVKGEGWNPGTSTRVEVDGATAVGGKGSTQQSSGGNQMTQRVPSNTGLLHPSRDLGSQATVRDIVIRFALHNMPKLWYSIFHSTLNGPVKTGLSCKPVTK